MILKKKRSRVEAGKKPVNLKSRHLTNIWYISYCYWNFNRWASYSCDNSLSIRHGVCKVGKQEHYIAATCHLVGGLVHWKFKSFSLHLAVFDFWQELMAKRNNWREGGQNSFLLSMPLLALTKMDLVASDLQLLVLKTISFSFIACWVNYSRKMPLIYIRQQNFHIFQRYTTFTVYNIAQAKRKGTSFIRFHKSRKC